MHENPNKPTMIFFDEMDKVLPNVSEEYYSDHSKAILAQLAHPYRRHEQQ